MATQTPYIRLGKYEPSDYPDLMEQYNHSMDTLDTKLHEQDTTLASLNAQVGKVDMYDTRISQLETDSANAKTELTRLDTKAQTLETSIEHEIKHRTEEDTKLDGRVTTLESTAQEHSETLSQHAGDINDLKDRSQDHETRLSDAENTLNTHAESLVEIGGDISDLESTDQDHESRILSLESTSAQYRTEMDSLSATNVSLYEDYKTLAQADKDAAEKITKNKTDILKVSDRVGQLEIDSIAHTGRITTLEEDMEDRIPRTEANQKHTEIYQVIQENKDRFDGKLTDLENRHDARITDLESKIDPETLRQDVESVVQDQIGEIDTYIDNYISQNTKQIIDTAIAAAIAQLGELSNVYASKEELTEYVKTNTAEETYAKITSLDDYLTTQTAQADYVKKDSIEEELTDYVKTEALTSVLEPYAKTETVNGQLATKADSSALDSYVLTETAESTYAKQAEVTSQLATKADSSALEAYATTASLASYATKSDLTSDANVVTSTHAGLCPKLPS